MAEMANTTSTNVDKKRINLALQGGGSHGAFTWGVLDRLLEDERIELEGLSGTSAGAVNAMVMASGLARGGREEARKSLEKFWMAVGEQQHTNMIRRNPIDVMFGRFGFDLSWSYHLFASFTHLVSPYHWNPLNINPLRDLIKAHIDFEAVRKFDALKIFVSATSVETGHIRVFRREEMSEDALMASTALPLMFHAAEVEGQHYWDGGFVGNPALFPLFYECQSQDIVIVQINPLKREAVPKSVFEIQDRMSEISFNASLASELRAVHFVNRLIQKGALDNGRYHPVLIHMIESEDEMRKLGSATKMLIEPQFLKHLFELGRDAADKWLIAHLESVGKQSSVDIRARFL
ncbi:patatin-like phospholipase family protein [soil metagenome]